MAQVYTYLIHKGLWTLEQVPERWRGEVEGLLDGEAAG